MKNKKCILIFTLIIAFLFVLVANVQATNVPVFDITSNVQTTNTANNVINNTDETVPIITDTNNTSTNNTTSNSDLPQTGVAEDTALFVFVAVCIVSAIYAFIKVRNYRSI